MGGNCFYTTTKTKHNPALSISLTTQTRQKKNKARKHPPPEISRTTESSLVIREIERWQIIQDSIERLVCVEQEGAHTGAGGSKVQSAFVEFGIVDVDGIAGHCCGIGTLSNDLDVVRFNKQKKGKPECRTY